MSIMKRKSKMSESDEKPTNLAVAYGVQRQNKRKMANGGVIYVDSQGKEKKDPKSGWNNEEKQDFKKGYEGGSPLGNKIKGMFGGDEPENKAHGGEIDCAHCMGSGRMIAEGGEIVDLEANDMEGPATDISHNMNAKDYNPLHEDSIEDQPMDSNEHGDELEDEDSHDKVGMIMKKMRKQRGM